MNQLFISNRRAGRFGEDSKKRSFDEVQSISTSLRKHAIVSEATSSVDDAIPRTILTVEKAEDALLNEVVDGASDEVIIEPRILHLLGPRLPTEFLPRSAYGDAGASSSGGGYVTPAGSGYLTPAGSGYVTPAGSGYVTPAGSGYVTPAGSGYVTPAGSGYVTPAGSGLITPAGGGSGILTPAGGNFLPGACGWQLPGGGIETNFGWLSRRGVVHDNNHRDVGTGQRINVTATSGDTGEPLSGATVIAVLRSFGEIEEISNISTALGNAAFVFGGGWEVAAIVVMPRSGHFSMVVRRPTGGSIEVTCPPIPASDDRLGWWHSIHGLDRFRANAGRGIRVGVVDSGCAQHADLSRVVNEGSLLNNVYDPQSHLDSSGHGTHVCGIIGSKPASGSAGYGGFAPGARIHSMRIFDKGEEGTDQRDVALAIDHLSKTSQVDIINLSLGATAPSAILHDSILDAVERGTTFVCAAGNSAGALEYPAAFPECIAVSALGQDGWDTDREPYVGSGPVGSVSAGRVPTHPSDFGDDGLYLANFSCRGQGIDCGGAGVGIVSTADDPDNEQPYTVMDGTSMAAPAVTGILAALLSGDDKFQQLDRDARRTQRAATLLRDACADIRMPFGAVGLGVPKV